MAKIQFAAQSYQARSLPVDAQRCVNMFVERSPPDAKTQVPVYMAPGLTTFSGVGNGPIIGMHVMKDTLYVVSGTDLYSVNSDGLATLIGATNLSNIAVMDDNETQLVMVDGAVGWIYQVGGLNQVTTATYAASVTSIVVAQTGTINAGDTIHIPLDAGGTFTTTVSGTPSGSPGALTIHLTAGLPSQVSAGAKCIVPTTVLGQITAPAFTPANRVVYFDGYFIFDANGTNQFFLSALGDGTQYSASDYATAQANPDLLLGVANYHEQLLLFGTRTIEVWYDSGNADFPFQRFDGALVQRGCAAPLAIVQEDNSVFWLGEDGIFYRLDGYQPVRVSTYATEHAWAQYSTTSNASAFVLTVEGHKFIFLFFPAGPATWCYDIASGAETPLWHERESSGSRWVT